MTFDGSATDSAGRVNVRENGSVSYADGYLGQGAVVGDDGYITISDYTPGTGSFTVAVWAKVSSVDGDPALFATKNWSSGTNAGFALGITSTSLHANIGSGFGHRADLMPSVPADFLNTWVHYTFVVDRDARQLKVSINFGRFYTVDFPATLVNAPFEGLGTLAIGQDATGTYGSSMTCIVDEFMVFDHALTQDELTALAQSYAG